MNDNAKEYEKPDSFCDHGFSALLRSASFFFLVSSGSLFFGACLFLVLLGTDFADGFLARKWGVSSKIGTYFDVTTDFVFVFSLFVAWMLKGFCPIWVLIVLAVIFGQFIVI